MYVQISFLESHLSAQRWVFPGGSVVRNPPANAGDRSSVPGSGSFPGEGHGSHSSSLAWEMPWTERSLAGYKVEPGVAESDTT